MPTKKKKSPDIKDLGLSTVQLSIAQDFVEELGIGTNDPLYYYAILWCKENVKSNGDFLTPGKRLIFDKDNNKKKKGKIHAEIYSDIIQLELKEEKKREQKTDPSASSKIRTETNKVNRQSPKPKKVDPPKVTITSDRIEVEKNEKYTISWKSENADVVSRSSGFADPIKDAELSGSREIISNRVGSKRFEITVRKGTRTARASVIVQTVAARSGDSTTPSSPQQQRQPRRQQSQTPTATTTTVRRSASGSVGSVAILTSINKSLTNIIKILEGQNKFIVKLGRSKAKEAENERRKGKEKNLELFKEVRAKVMSRVMAPIQSFFDLIIKFLVNVFLGRVFTEFLRWFNDPKNADKVKTLGRFLKDFWPILAGVAAWFFTPLGGFVKGLVKTLMGFSRVLLRHPVIALATIGGTALASLGIAHREGVDKEKEENLKSLDRAYDSKNYGRGTEATIRQQTFGEKFKMFFNRFESGGIVTEKTGTKVRGAGQDTQLTVLTPGEAVLQKGARERMIASTGIDPLSFNIGPSANNPKTLLGSKLTAMSTGGVVGMKNPKISQADYNALLAIAAAEDTANLQGRADVAQSLYNRLYASKQYGVNFMQKKDTLKDIITASGQFQPTFKNLDDWLAINDRNSAARAFANYKKIPIPQALKILAETDKVLKDPKFQENARRHVQGRTFFLGTSQQSNMKTGDVLRGPSHNFFSHWETENTPYHRERGNIAAPIPLSLVPRATSTPRQRQPQGPLETISRMIFGSPRPAAASPQNSRRRPQRAWYDPRGLMGFNRGGLHVTNSMPKTDRGHGLDVYPALLSHNEYVVPSRTVSTVGVDFFDKLVASTDKNSNAARLHPIKKNSYIPTPLSAGTGSFQVLNLPPVVTNTEPQIISRNTTPTVPSFSAISPSSANVRQMLAEIYGIG